MYVNDRSEFMSFDRLVKKVRENDIVLWVGAGFSLYAGMPSADVLRDLIIDNCKEDEKAFFENISLGEVAETFVELRNGSRNELYRLLQKAIDIEPKSIWAHRLIAEIPQIDLIVTTNYDKLFEEAYGRDIATIISNSHLPLATKRIRLFKIHGDINVHESIVITSSDYSDFFRNQDKPLWNKIKTLLTEKTVIFLGYSLSDQNINYLFENVIKDIGSFKKESYLIAPNLPPHTKHRLTQKGIHYIDMYGEEFITNLHREIKKNLLEDILENKVDKEKGLGILESKYGLNATIQTTSKGSVIKSLGSELHKKMNLNVKFEGVNFFQLFKDSPFDAFEIPGENIKAMNSSFEGISIPNVGKIASLKVVPLPSKIFNADLYFKGSNILLSNVYVEVFNGFDSSLLRFTHDLAVFEFDFEKRCFHFRLKEFKRLRDLEEIIEFLSFLVSGEEPLILYIRDSIDGDIPVDEKEIDFIQMDSDDNNNIREELMEIQQLVEVLKKIQKHYRITFRDFEFNLTEDVLKIIGLLELHMTKEAQLINKLYFFINDIKFYDNTMNHEKFIEEVNHKQKQFVFESKERIGIINLFNQEIEINDELIIMCNDAFIKKVSMSSKNIDDNNFKLELTSVGEGIKIGFLNT